MSKTKLIRKQVLLDKALVNQIEFLLHQNKLKISFSKYLRSLIQKDLQTQKKKPSKKINLLKTKVGFLKNGGFKNQKAEDLSKEIDAIVYG